MSVIIASGTADAPNKLPQEDVKKFVYSLFANSRSDIERMISVFDNSSVQTRHFSAPVQWFSLEHSFAEKNKLYVETSIKLAEQAINKCLDNAGASINDINHIMFVSSTGLSTPSIDAILFNSLKFDGHVKRTPIWGLGCAGGAVGLSRAMEYTKAFPESNVLLIAVELCSLTFIKNDFSKSNIVATSLFSDGSACVLVSGSNSKLASKGKMRLFDSLSTTYIDSLDVMGWNVVEEGLRVVFSKDIPSIVRNCVKPNILEIVQSWNITPGEIKHFIAHPGGIKVINAYEESLELKNGSMNLPRKVLKEHGNMSSPSVLYVLEEFLKEGKHSSDEYGLISALGPGFSSELILFKTI
jgi:alkylresorcinol/alkylpyrone synthase